MRYELLAYAMDFASFLILKLGEDCNKIKSVILFGSVARMEATKNSDVDIFIDVFANEDAISKKISRIKEDFYKSVKFNKFWKLMDIENDIKPIVGKLDEWKDLKASILANGIVLYGTYQGIPGKSKHVILFWENIKPQSRRVTINKQIFGYTHYGKKYRGLFQTYGGLKLGKGAIQIPIESYPVFIKLFRKYRIPVKIKYVMV